LTFDQKAQYHSACITNYLLKWKKDHSADNYSTIKNESEHDIAFKKFLDILHRDLSENKKAFIVNGQEAQQIIMKLTSCGIQNVFDTFTTFNAVKFSIFLDSLLSTKNTIVPVYDNYSTIKNESEHDIAFKKFLDILHRDLSENKKAFTMSSLLDQCCLHAE
jgi:hypothetical protein